MENTADYDSGHTGDDTWGGSMSDTDTGSDLQDAYNKIAEQADEIERLRAANDSLMATMAADADKAFEEIERLRQALRDEREACAKIADQFRQEWNGTALRDRTKGAEIIAAAIRNQP